MCGVFGAVLPAGEPTDAAALSTLGLFALQHRGQESAGLAVSDGEQLMLYKDLGMISTVLDERRLPSLRGRLAIAHCRYSTTGSTIWENAQPTYRQGPRRAIAIGHNGNLVNTRELLAQLEGGRARLPASTDTELLTALHRRRAGRRHRRGAVAGPAPRPWGVQPGRARPAPGHRHPRPARVPAAGPRAPARERHRPVPTRACGGTTTPRPAGASHRRRRRSTSSARSTSATSSRARSSSWSPGRRHAPSATRRRIPPCACSSSSTSPGRTPTWRAATSTRCAGGWGSSSRSSTRSTPTS